MRLTKFQENSAKHHMQEYMISNVPGTRAVQEEVPDASFLASCYVSKASWGP